MRHQIESAIVRITNQAGTPIGAGLLAAEGKILTCAHVIREALGLLENPPEPPDAALRLDFPLVDGNIALLGHVFLWRPELDIAGLAIDGAVPEAARPLTLVAAADFWEHPFRAYGFPKGREDGVWAKGEMRGPQAQGWLQIDTGSGGYHVEPGFSGGPVWDEVLGGVVGLVTRSDTKAGVRAAYVIPVSQLIEAWSDLADKSRPPSPYRGLRAFREADTANFYGRDNYTAKLVQETGRNNFVAVIGPSGSGKSSVVFAGLIPELRQDDAWLIIDFRPGRDPFRSLSAALLPHLEPDINEVDRLVETSKLAAALEVGDLHLTGILERLLERDGAVEYVLLIADQFEELYTLCEALERRRRFLDVLLTLPNNGPSISPFTLCLALRADFMGQALSYRPFADLLQDHDVKLGPMNREELRAAIVEPAAALNVKTEPGLANRILDDVGQEPGNLPLLEFALTLLWEKQQLGRLTHDAYEAIGQVQGALAGHAEAIFARLSPEEQAVARAVFVQLVQPGAGTADTRRLATREEVDDGNWALVQQLASERLLTTSSDEQGRETVEVTHEALIQHWERLQEWMVEDRTFREWQQRLRASMAMWLASEQDNGALLRGAPLAEANAWLAERGERLPQSELDYINAGILFQDLEAQAEKERIRQREAFVQEQANSRRFRRLTRWLGITAVFALIATIVALAFMVQAQEDAQKAAAARSTANANAIVAQTSEANAQKAQATADANASIAQEREMRALDAENNISALKNSIKASQLAQASRAERTARPELSLLLAVTGVGLSKQPDTLASVVSAISTTLYGTELFAGPNYRISSIAFSQDGTWTSIATSTRGFRIADRSGNLSNYSISFTNSNMNSFTNSDMNSVAFNPNNDREIVASGRSGNVQVFHFDDSFMSSNLGASQEASLIGHQGTVYSAVFNPQGTQILTAGSDRTAKLWSLDGNEVVSFEGHRGPVTSAVFNPQGTQILTAGSDGTVKLWSLDGNEVASFEGNRGPVYSAVFNPRGTQILTAGSDGTVKLWSLDGNEVASFEGHRGPVYSAVFNPQGTQILTAGSDGTARLWDTSADEIVILERHIAPVLKALFSPDGERIVTASNDGMVIMWLWPPSANVEDLVVVARSRIVRGFSDQECAIFFGNDRDLCPQTIAAVDALFETGVTK